MRAARLPLVPLGRREFLKDAVDLIADGGRSDGFGEDTQAGAALGALAVQHLAETGEERGPGADLPTVSEGAGAIRIVEAEHRSLHVDVGRAEARGMLRVTLYLDRPSFPALRQHAVGYAAERHRGGVEQSLAEHDFFRLTHVGYDLLGGLARAGGESRKPQRGGHDLQELAPALPVLLGPFRSLPREFAVKHLLELLAVREVFQASPVLFAALAGQLGAKGGQVELLSFSHRWHVLQLVRVRWSWILYWRTKRGPSVAWLSAGWYPMVVTNSRGRTWRSGLRWQSRHQLIWSEFSCHISGMRSTRPWQDSHPMPLFT